jgi:hypothetical protein
MGIKTLICLLLSYLAMVEVKYEKGTHSRVCRMLHLDNHSLKLMRVQFDLLH